jgi:glucokinase
MARDAGLGDVDARAVEAAAVEGDPRALQLWEGAIAACAAGTSSLVMSFYPSTVVIRGGMGRRQEFFGPIHDLVMSRPEHHPADLAIVRSALGDDAGLAGTAAWVAASRSR